MKNIYAFAIIFAVKLILSNSKESWTFNSSASELNVGLKIGTPGQAITFELSTVSPYTLIASSASGSAKSNFYNHTNSTTYYSKKTLESFEVMLGKVNGTDVEDIVEFQNVRSKLKFPFVEISKYITYDGKIGNPSHLSKLALAYKHPVDDDYLFLHRLKQNKYISKQVFSIQTNSKTNQHSINFGGYPAGIQLKTTSQCRVSCSDDLEEIYKHGWICDISHYILNKEVNLTQAINITSGKAVFVNDFPFIVVPLSEEAKFSEIFNNCTITKSWGKSSTNYLCKQAPPKDMKLSLVINGYAYVISAEKLFFNVQNQYMSYFIFENSSLWKLGTIFLKNYQVTFDKDKSRVFFMGGDRKMLIKQSESKGDTKKNEEKKKSEEKVGNWAWFSKNKLNIIIAIVVLFAVLACLVVFFVIRARKRAALMHARALVEDNTEQRV